jgi:Retinal pigment epithelial membrane protein
MRWLFTRLRLYLGVLMVAIFLLHSCFHTVGLTGRTAPEADGYLITFANRRDTMLSSILILDTATLEDGPIAIIELPFRLRAGIHGSWVPAAEFQERKELCDMEGVTDEMRAEYASKGVKTSFLGELRNGDAENRGLGGKW